MINVTADAKIYVVIGARYVSGGTESMYQLFYNLKELGYNTYIYYKPGNVANPVPNVYAKYKPDIVEEIEDSPKNVLIVPEISPFILYRYKSVRKVIYWLSIDNYYGFLNNRYRSWFKHIIKEIIGYNRTFLIHDKSTHHNNIYHISQSKYAIEHLRQAGIPNAAYTPDYIHEDFVKNEIDFSSANRQDIVAYNPVKGFEFTKRLIAANPGVNWVPLVDMTPAQVADTLQKSKVYIDFGNHPGKDRFPREAALMGCCIITNKTGSAYYDEDVNTPAGYKFDEAEFDQINACINKCVADYDTVINEFAGYRKFIADHKKVLQAQILNVFKKQ